MFHMFVNCSLLGLLRRYNSYDRMKSERKPNFKESRRRRIPAFSVGITIQIKDVSIKTISKYFPMFYGTPCTFKSSSRKEWCMIKDFHRINCSVEDFVLLYFSLSLKKRKLLKIMNLPKLGYLNTFYQGKASFQVYRCESNMAFHDWRVNKYMFIV